VVDHCVQHVWALQVEAHFHTHPTYVLHHLFHFGGVAYRSGR